MRIVRLAFLMTAFAVTQTSFAMESSTTSEGASCGTIAKACLDGGYKDKSTNGKQFWLDCMKPLILGQSVKGVSVSGDTIRTCRDNKIAEMKQELSELEKASS